MRALRGLEPRVKIVRIERPEADRDLRDAARVAAAAAPLDERVQVAARVGQQALAAGDLGRLQQRVFVSGLSLRIFL